MASVAAHDSRPIFIQVDVQAAGQFQVSWKIPDSVEPAAAPDVVLVGDCRDVVIPTQAAGESGAQPGDALVGLRWYTCPSSGQHQQNVSALLLKFPGAAPPLSALVRVQWPDGSTHTVHAAPGELRIALPVRDSTAGVFRQYFALGVEHILRGYDHLLFVACLLLLAGGWRRVVLAVTGFTAAHSVTLALAALGWVTLPVPPVEAAIALSILVLAAELARAGRDTLMWRYPLAVAAVFGLLHGFGFASVLGDIGLPGHEVPAALLAFNLGVEAGQLCFIALLLAGFAFLQRWLPEWLRGNASLRVAAYPIGVIAAFWFVERLSAFI